MLYADGNYAAVSTIIESNNPRLVAMIRYDPIVYMNKMHNRLLQPVVSMEKEKSKRLTQMAENMKTLKIFLLDLVNSIEMLDLD